MTTSNVFFGTVFHIMGKTMSALPYLPETIPGKAQCPLLGQGTATTQGHHTALFRLECVNIYTWGFLVWLWQYRICLQCGRPTYIHTLMKGWIDEWRIKYESLFQMPRLLSLLVSFLETCGNAEDAQCRRRKQPRIEDRQAALCSSLRTGPGSLCS